MIPHRTIAISPRDLIGSADYSILKKYIPQPHIYWTGSCRSALSHVVTGRVGIPAFTCHVVRDAVKRVGSPVYFDSGVIADPAQIEPILNKIDTLLLPYNFGFMPDMHTILAMCQKHNVTLVEDCALALGSVYDGSLAGSFGQRAVWSANISKNMGVIGGIIGSHSPLDLPALPPYPFGLQLKAVMQTLLSRLFFHPMLYRWTHKLLVNEFQKSTPNLEYSLPQWAARVNLTGMQRYEKVMAQRRHNAHTLCTELDGVIEFVTPMQNNLSNWPSFVMMHKERHNFQRKLQKKGIDITPWHTYGNLSGKSSLAEKTAARMVVFETLRPSHQIDAFIRAVKEVER